MWGKQLALQMILPPLVLLATGELQGLKKYEETGTSSLRVFGKRQAASAPRCAIECSKDPECIAFAFTDPADENNNCFLHNDEKDGTATNIDGKQATYFRQKKEMMDDVEEMPEISEWRTIGTMEVLIEETEMNWSDALKYCHSAGGSMIKIESASKLRTVQYAIKTYWANGDAKFWLGGSDITKENEFVWIDSSPVFMTSEFWCDGEPNNDNEEDCMAFFTDKFNDVDCNTQLVTICER